MRKSELAVIKIREYKRGLSDAKLTISNRDVRGWAEEAYDRACLEGIEDAIKEMLREIGVTICPATSNVVDRGENPFRGYRKEDIFPDVNEGDK